MPDPWWLPLVDLTDAAAPLDDYERGFTDALFWFIGQEIRLSLVHRSTLDAMLTRHAAALARWRTTDGEE